MSIINSLVRREARGESTGRTAAVLVLRISQVAVHLLTRLDRVGLPSSFPP